MRVSIVGMIVVAAAFAAGGAIAQDLGSRAPAKDAGLLPAEVVNPPRQGGDTIGSATPITALPYNDTGTTVGYADDYNSSCYTDNGAPDVVYRVTLPVSTGIMISLCGSTYDTAVQVLDASLNQIACNDDYCGLQSQIADVPVTAGQTYYIVVDGYGSAAGDYTLLVTWPPLPCVLACPAASNPPEGEPPLHDGYWDTWNSGCGNDGEPVFQHIAGALPESDLPAGEAVFCGVSGWFVNDGSNYRDTDWFTLTKGSASVPITITADAEYATYFFHLAPTDCNDVAVAQQATGGPCDPVTMSIDGPAGTVWFWVGPTVFTSPDGTVMYDYVVWFSGLAPEIVETEAATWSAVKALYN